MRKGPVTSVRRAPVGCAEQVPHDFAATLDLVVWQPLGNGAGSSEGEGVENRDAGSLLAHAVEVKRTRGIAGFP